MEKDNNLQYATLFGNNADISLDERARVLAELKKTGNLTFTVKTSEEGWVAQCDQIGGIITGGTNTNPTQNEIESQIRDAIYAAFNVRVKSEKESPYFAYSDVGSKNKNEHKSLWQMI